MARIRIRRLLKKLLAIGVLFCAATTTALAQFGFFRQREPNPLPPHPRGEFHLARFVYYSPPGCVRCGSYWSIDYPDAEIHFLPTLERFTRIDVADDSVHIHPMDEEIFDYPFLFLQQPGIDPWDPTEEQAAILREYLLRGGFLVADDFHGPTEWLRFERAIKRVLPEFPIVEIPEDDLLLNIIFDLDQRTQIPGERHVLGERMRGPAEWHAIYDDQGRMLVAINFNIDMGDGWEHADDAHYPLEMTALAYRFGVNYVIYAMTH